MSDDEITNFIENERQTASNITDPKEKKEYERDRHERLLQLSYNDDAPPILKIRGGNVYILVGTSSIQFTHRLQSLLSKFKGRQMTEDERESIRQMAILITTNLRWDTIVNLNTPDLPKDKLIELDKQPEWLMKEPLITKEVKKPINSVDPDSVEPEVTF